MAIHGSLGEVSNREDWVQPGTILDSTTKEPFDITDAAIKVVLRDQNTKTTYLTADIGSGVTITDASSGEFEWHFTVAQMHGIEPETYDVGVIVTKDNLVSQLFAGTIEVYDGVIP